MAAVDVIWLVLAILALHGHLVVGCYFGGSSSCIFPCNCANNDPCNRDTGTCPGGCRDGQPRPADNETRFDWRGPGCRIGNVALHKAINQSGVHEQWYANQSVDGKLPSSEGGEESSCTHTAGNKATNAWWSVDLEGVYQIYNITIYNRIQLLSAQRTENITINVGNSSDISKNSLCLKYPGRVPAGGNVTLACTSSTIGRFVSIHRIGGVQTNIINICEVVVMGYEAVGVDCSRCDTDCNNIVGCRECVGFKPPLCTASCDAGRYGINCVSSCSDHYCVGGNITCDQVTGECPDGCIDWYIGEKCDTHINELEFNSILSTEVIKETQIKVTWGPDGEITPNLAQYYGYKVQYKVSNDSVFLSGPNVSHVPGMTEYNAIISSLIHNSWYILRVSIYRHNGGLYEVFSRPTPEQMVKTPCVDPDQVTNLRLSPITHMMPAILNVEWTSESSGCDSISSIQIIYRSNISVDWMIHVVANPSTSTSTTITDVTDGVWDVKVLVVNNEQLSSVSETRSVDIFNALGRCETWTRLTLTLAVLLGFSAVVNFGVLINCAWIKLHKKRNTSIPTKSVQTDETDAGTSNYEDLQGPTFTMPDSTYDEIHMGERQAMPASV